MITTIKDAVAVGLPAAEVQDRILRYFESRRRADGSTKLDLRVPLKDFGLPEDVEIDRAVAVRASKRRDAENLNDEIGISWSPGGTGIFPAFDGRIVVWSEDRPDASYVEIEGTYEPPMGPAGELFDAAIGHLIAQRTAKALLLELRDAVVTMESVPGKT